MRSRAPSFDASSFASEAVAVIAGTTPGCNGCPSL